MPALQALIAAGYRIIAVYTQPDRPAGRGRKPKPSAVKQAALQAGIEVYQPISLRQENAQEQLQKLAPDLLAVTAYGLLLPRAVLDIPHLGCINIHASLLPRWRGAAPIQRAIQAGDAETGVTLMHMDEGLDTGPMLAWRATPIQSADTAQSVHDRLARMGAELLIQTLPDWVAHQISPLPQNNKQVTYACKLEKIEAEIDWSRPASEIVRHIQAFNLWPVARTRWRGETMKVLDARAIDQPANLPPGTLIVETRQGIDVATGHGVLRILRLQLPGRRPQAAVDFINGYQLGREPLPN